YTCGRLLEHLIYEAIDRNLLDPNLDIGSQLLELCYKPKEVLTWPLGKYKGTKLKDVPTDYYEWAINKPLDLLDESSTNYDRDLAHSVMKVLNERFSEHA